MFVLNLCYCKTLIFYIKEKTRVATKSGISRKIQEKQKIPKLGNLYNNALNKKVS